MLKYLPMSLFLVVLLVSLYMLPVLALPYLLSYAPNWAVAVVILLFFCTLAAVFVYFTRYWLGRYRRSGNLTEFSLPLLFSLMFFSYLYVTFMYLFFWGFWYDFALWGMVLSLLPALVIILAIPVLMVVTHMKGHKAALSDGGIIPRYLRVAAHHSQEFQDGYSSRPVDTGVELEKTGRLEDFARFLMFSVVVLDYRIEKDGSVRLFLVPGPDGRARFLFAFRGMEETCSWVLLPSDGSQLQVMLSQEDYQLLGLPVSYHLLGTTVAKRLGESYRYFIEGDKKKAIDVMRWHY